MLIILISLAIFMLCVWVQSLNPKYHFRKCGNLADFVSFIGACVSTIVLILSLTCFTLPRIMSAGEEAQTWAIYDSLNYRLDNLSSYTDQFELEKANLIREIQAWNEDMAFSKGVRESFWFKDFACDWVDDFELIDYSKLTE